MVIAIIAVLMGMLIPAISSMREKARVAKAKADMMTLKTAILNYEATYGTLPFIKDSSSEDPGSNELWNDKIKTELKSDGTEKNTSEANKKRYDQLIQILANVNITSDDWTAVKNAKNEGNIRNIKMLDVQPEFEKKGLRDPWGNRYVILIDGNYDGVVTKPSDSAATYKGSVFIYSLGPNKTDDNGLNRISGGPKGSDDITSWDN